MQQTPDEDYSPSELEVQTPQPPFDVEITPESDEGCGAGFGLLDESCDESGWALEDYRFQRLQSEVDHVKQKLQERKELHDLRKDHAKRLFALTYIWIFSVLLIVLLQGFGQWFMPLSFIPFGRFEYLSFQLSDTVLIAFMTTTTTAVLGLYGIAAYWLYGNGKGRKKKKPSDDR